MYQPGIPQAATGGRDTGGGDWTGKRKGGPNVEEQLPSEDGRTLTVEERDAPRWEGHESNQMSQPNLVVHCLKHALTLSS